MARWALKNRPEIQNRAAEQLRCSSWLVFRQALAGADLRPRLHAADFCQQFHTCQLCAIRKGGKALSVVAPKLQAVMEAHPHLVAYFVTLTVRNTEQLGDALLTLFKGLGRLMQQMRSARLSPMKSPAMRSVVGGIGHVETKRGSGSGDWHPHYHGVWLCDPARQEREAPHALMYKALNETWERGTGGKVTWCRKLHSEFQRPAGVRSDIYREALIKDLCETIKYSVKFEGTGLAGDYWEAADVLRGKRLLRGFGLMRGVKVPDDLRDGKLDWKQLEYIDRFFRYVGAARYAEVQRPNMPPES